MTRFADLRFLIGILALSYYTGTFNFMDLTSSQLVSGAYHVNLETAENIKNIFATSAAPTFMGASVLTWASSSYSWEVWVSPP